ncbi:MAG: DUF2283 domain-containing protein [Bacteroidetes bacterium]|nr:DUF2283 domain-containing protein [Bacteroidota bacterium]
MKEEFLVNMEKTVNFFYDKKGDILDIAIGKPQPAISQEISDDVLIRRHPETNEIVGFTILNFELRFTKTKKPYSIPITASFQLHL